MHKTRVHKSKYGAKKTEFNGKKFDSKFEATIAQELELRKKAGEILDYDCQFKIECMPYNIHGDPVPKCKVSHKVDFRVHNLDGTFTLLEAKGFVTADYKMRAKWLEYFWLPANPDYDYEVVFQRKSNFR